MTPLPLSAIGCGPFPGSASPCLERSVIARPVKIEAGESARTLAGLESIPNDSPQAVATEPWSSHWPLCV